MTLLAVGCGIAVDQVSSPVSVQARPDVPEDTRIDPPSTTSTTPVPLTSSGLQAVAADLQQFWASTLPSVYDVTYRPVADDRVVAAAPGIDIPPCDGERIKYNDVKGNAFAANCSEGPLVVWDAVRLIPQLNANFGPAAAAVVLAHEWGHIAQFEAKVGGLPTVLSEQQADCFAGAWLADTVEDPGDLDEVVAAHPLDTSISSIIAFRDNPGRRKDDPSAHGSGFDRVRALQEGVDRGAAFCARYPEDQPALTEIPFNSPEEAATGGNLTLGDLVPLVVEDLNAFYGQVVTGFKGATEADVMGDGDTVSFLQDLTEKIGDGAAGLALGIIWAQFAQRQVGADEGRDASARLLQQACMAGGWLATVFPREGRTAEEGLQLSAGDLDESILALIALAKAEKGFEASEDGALFELVADLRQGVIEGFDSCGLRR